MFKTEINIIYPLIIKQLQIKRLVLIIHTQGSVLKIHYKLQQSVEVLKVIIYKCDLNEICHSGMKVNSLLTSNYLSLTSRFRVLPLHRLLLLGDKYIY